MIFLTTKMKNFLRIFLFIFAVIVIGSCKKEPIPVTPPVPAPVFTFNGTVGGSPVKIEAGVNNYYMFTTCKTYTTSGVYDFGGEFRDKDCSTGNCPNTLKLVITDYRPYFPTPTVPDSSIAPGYY